MKKRDTHSIKKNSGYNFSHSLFFRLNLNTKKQASKLTRSKAKKKKMRGAKSKLVLRPLPPKKDLMARFLRSKNVKSFDVNPRKTLITDKFASKQGDVFRVPRKFRIRNSNSINFSGGNLLKMVQSNTSVDNFLFRSKFNSKSNSSDQVGQSHGKLLHRKRLRPQRDPAPKRSSHKKSVQMDTIESVKKFRSGSGSLRFSLDEGHAQANVPVQADAKALGESTKPAFRISVNSGKIANFLNSKKMLSKR